MMRGREAASRLAHNQEIAGASPAPATISGVLARAQERDESHDSCELPSCVEKLPAANRVARASVIAAAEAVDFTKMTRAEFGAWVDRLHWSEFFALLSLVDDWHREHGA